MALTFAIPTNGADFNTALATNAYTTGSITFTAGRLYVIGAVNTAAAGSVESPSVVGASTGTWAAVTGAASVSFNTVASSASRLNCQTVQPVATVSETLAITYATNRTSCGWIVVEITGHDASGTIVQADTGRDDAKTSLQAMAANALTLAAFGNAVTNGLLVFASNDLNSTMAAGGSLVELADQTWTGPNTTFAAYYQNGEDTTPDVTFLSSDCGAAAMEIKAAAVASGCGSTAKRQSLARRFGMY